MYNACIGLSQDVPKIDTKLHYWLKYSYTPAYSLHNICLPYIELYNYSELYNPIQRL